MDEQVSRLVGWSKKEEHAPFAIEVHPTNRCNLNCLMCGTRFVYREKAKKSPSFNPKSEVSFEVSKERWLKLVEESHELGVKKWLITGGGEPMLRKEITLPLIEKIKMLGMYGNMNTNGTLFDTKDIERIVLSGWDMIMFSVDGIGKVHDFIRNTPEVFDKLFKTMILFKKLKKKHGIKNPKIVFNTVITKQNYDKLADIIKLGKKIGCEDITFMPLISFGDFGVRLDLNKDEKSAFESSIPSLKGLSKKWGITTNLESFTSSTLDNITSMDKVIINEPKKETGFLSVLCYEPFLNIVVRMDGKISPCCMLENDKDNIKNSSLKDIWYGNYFNTLRNCISQGKLLEGCKTCVHSQFVHNQKLREQLKFCME